MKKEYNKKGTDLNLCARELIKYYQEKGLLIIGMNDAQCINVNLTSLKKGLLEKLTQVLTTNDFKPEVINAFSLFINKTEHIDYLLKANVSVEEIKLAQLYGMVKAFEKVASDINVPSGLGKVGNLYKGLYTINPTDKTTFIATALQQAVEPTLIYSSGANNLMREVGSNPFSIKKDYKNKDISSKYSYILEKLEDPKILKKVFEGVERNFDNILTLNPYTDIYALGIYIPKSLQKEELRVFRSLIRKYNETLNEICKSYKISYIDTNDIISRFSKKSNNFHIESQGHDVLANYLLLRMYQNKILFRPNNKAFIPNYFTPNNKGVEGVIDRLIIDYEKAKDQLEDIPNEGYEKMRQLEIIEERLKEIEIFEKVLKRTKNR